MANFYKNPDLLSDEGITRQAQTPADANPAERNSDEQIMQDPSYMKDAKERQANEAQDIADIQASNGQTNAGGVAVGGFGNVAGRMAADQRADAERAAALPAQMRERAANMAPPQIPPPQMPTTQFRDGKREAVGTNPDKVDAPAVDGRDTLGSDGNPDGGRNVYYGSKMAHYDKDGNITGWWDAQSGKQIDAPKSMQMVGGVQPDKGDFPDVRSAQEWARKNREQKRMAVADKNIEIAKFAGVALEAAHRDGRTVTSKSGEKYMIGVVPTEQIKSLNDKLSAMGKHTVEKIGAFQRLNAEGRPVGEPQFVIRYKQNGAESAAGKSVFLQLSKTDLLNGLKESYDAKGDYDGLAKYEKDTFRDYAGEIKAEKQAEEDLANKIRNDNLKASAVVMDALGRDGGAVARESTGTIVQRIVSNPNALQFFKDSGRMEPVYETDAQGNVVKDKNGQPVQMLDKSGNPMTRSIQLTDQQALQRITAYVNAIKQGDGSENRPNADWRDAYRFTLINKMMQDNGTPIPQGAPQNQSAPQNQQPNLADVEKEREELLRLKAQQGGGAQAPTAPAPTAIAPAAPQNPNAAPAQSPQATAPQTPVQPAQTQFAPQEQPQGGVQNIVSDLSQQTFGDPNPAAQKPYPTAQKSASPYIQQMREDEESKRQTRPGNHPRAKQNLEMKRKLNEDASLRNKKAPEVARSESPLREARKEEDEREYRKWVEDKKAQREQERNQPIPETKAQKTVSELSRLESMARGFDKNDPLHDIMAEFADDLAKRIKKIEDINKSANAEADKLIADMG